jgi:branched-chain amino acid aminotransferase
VTRGLREAFFGLFDGRTRDRWGWLEFVHAPVDGTANPGQGFTSAVVPDRESQKAAIHGRTPHQQPASMEASA